MPGLCSGRRQITCLISLGKTLPAARSSAFTTQPTLAAEHELETSETTDAGMNWGVKLILTARTVRRDKHRAPQRWQVAQEARLRTEKKPNSPEEGSFGGGKTGADRKHLAQENALRCALRGRGRVSGLEGLGM